MIIYNNNNNNHTIEYDVKGVLASLKITASGIITLAWSAANVFEKSIDEFFKELVTWC